MDMAEGRAGRRALPSCSLISKKRSIAVDWRILSLAFTTKVLRYCSSPARRDSTNDGDMFQNDFLGGSVPR